MLAVERRRRDFGRLFAALVVTMSWTVREADAPSQDWEGWVELTEVVLQMDLVWRCRKDPTASLVEELFLAGSSVVAALSHVDRT